MIRVLIIDDEPLALKMMKDLLEQYDCIEIVGCFTEYSDAIDYTDLDTISAIFIDIQLADINGIDAGHSLKELNRSIDIIFVTSYEHYTLEAFEVFATDYLLKPVFKERLDKTINQLMYKHNLTKDDQNRKKLAVTCFNQLNLLDSNGRPIKWRTAKTGELAAFLLHNKGEFINRDIIIESLWENNKDVDRLLYTTVYYLRKTFKKLGFNSIVILKNSSYKISLDSFTIDFIRYERYLKSPTIETMEKAVTLYRGDYFYSSDYQWAHSQREIYRTQYEDVLRKLCEHYLAKHNYAKVMHYAKNSLQSNPFQEDLHKMLIHVYYEKRDFSTLKSYYEQTKRLYREELSIQPPSIIHDEYLKTQQNR